MDRILEYELHGFLPVQGQSLLVGLRAVRDAVAAREGADLVIIIGIFVHVIPLPRPIVTCCKSSEHTERF